MYCILYRHHDPSCLKSAGGNTMKTIYITDYVNVKAIYII